MKRALIVGAGASGFLHALALRSAGVAITSVYDPDTARAEWLAGLTGGQAVSSLSTDVDIAAICSPPHRHLEQAAMLASAERLVFVEKPVVVTHDELAEMARLPNVVPIVQWRAGQSARRLREAFARGVFGPSPKIDCTLRLWRDAAYFATRADWGSGALLSIGIHAIDLVLWTVGRPVLRAVRSESGGRAGMGTATRGELEIAFEGGASASIRITLDASLQNDVRLFVRGASASAELRAGEADPTAMPMLWRGTDPPRADGATGAPLLVPYLHAALAGQAPTIADVAEAHALALGNVFA